MGNVLVIGRQRRRISRLIDRLIKVFPSPAEFMDDEPRYSILADADLIKGQLVASISRGRVPAVGAINNALRLCREVQSD